MEISPASPSRHDARRKEPPTDGYAPTGATRARRAIPPTFSLSWRFGVLATLAFRRRAALWDARRRVGHSSGRLRNSARIRSPQTVLAALRSTRPADSE